MPRGRPKNSGKSVIKVPLQFDYAETVEALAKPIISQYHTHLINCKLVYVYRNKPMKNKGRIVFATAQTCSALTRDLCKISGGEGYDFIITINYESWNQLSDAQKKAVLDHELCHCVVDEAEDGTIKLSIAPHEISEFSTIVDRYGPAIFEDLRRFCELAKKKMLPSESPVVKIAKPIDPEDLLE